MVQMLLTRADIVKMKAGVELDALLAEYVTHEMVAHLPAVYEEGTTPDGLDGWAGFVCPRCRRPVDMLDEPCLRYYSRELAASREIVAAMISNGWTFRLTMTPGGIISAWFEKHLQFIQRPEVEKFDEIHNAEADTEPLAICRAALIAITESR